MNRVIPTHSIKKNKKEHRRPIMQKKLTNVLGAALFALVPTAAMASSHSEAPAINEDPAADNTDLYAWVTPGTRDKLFLVANFIPLQEPSGGPNWKQFSDDVRYE